jgi:ADP-ribosylglycohydrolase
MDLLDRRGRVVPMTSGLDVDTARDRIRGCLLAGAIGDALGAPIEFMDLTSIRARFGTDGVTSYAPAYGRDGGAITDDTQMTLFTAEGMIRSWVRGDRRGTADQAGAIRQAYGRWYATQTGRWPFDESPDAAESGWLVGIDGLHRRRAPGNTCLGALSQGAGGTRHRPINDSKGCGGVMRVAPVGLATVADPFEVAAECAALTHGHPSGWVSAGALALLIAELLRDASLDDALDVALARARRTAGGTETVDAIVAARDLAGRGRPTPEELETLGGGWVGEEALAVAVCCALVADDLRDGLLLAVNHSGDSDSTGSIVGNILGVRDGEAALPADLLQDLELRDEITRVADDLTDAFHGNGVGGEHETDGDRSRWWSERYPAS